MNVLGSKKVGGTRSRSNAGLTLRELNFDMARLAPTRITGANLTSRSIFICDKARGLVSLGLDGTGGRFNLGGRRRLTTFGTGMRGFISRKKGCVTMNTNTSHTAGALNLASSVVGAKKSGDGKVVGMSCGNANTATNCDESSLKFICHPI